MKNRFWNLDQATAGGIVKEYFPQMEGAAEGSCYSAFDGMLLRHDNSDSTWTVTQKGKETRGGGKPPSPTACLGMLASSGSGVDALFRDSEGKPVLLDYKTSGKV